MADVILLLVPFFGLILVGYAAAKATGQKAEALGWMNTFIIYAALPALFFKLASATPIEHLQRFDYVGTTVGATYVIFFGLLGLSRFVRRQSLPDATIKSFAASYGNIVYMGPPFALMALGESATVPVALIVCVENAVHFAVAPAMMALAGGDNRPKWQVVREIVKKVALHPFVLATGLGFSSAYLAIPAPAPLQTMVNYLAQAASPCALFALGVTLALRPVQRIPTEIGAIALLKLIIHPAAVYIALSLIGGFEPVWIYSAVILAALPTAANVFVISQHYGAWQERASASILIITVLSAFTLPVVLYLINSGSLPVNLFR